MAKVEIDHRKYGMTLDEWMAKRHPAVKLGMITHTNRVAKKARKILAAHKHDGHAYIKTGRDKYPDRYIELNDTRGQLAAMTIEFGRKGDTVYQSGPNKGQPVPAMNPVAPLRKALGRAVPTYKGLDQRRERA